MSTKTNRYLLYIFIIITSGSLIGNNDLTSVFAQENMTMTMDNMTSASDFFDRKSMGNETIISSSNITKATPGDFFDRTPIVK